MLTVWTLGLATADAQAQTLVTLDFDDGSSGQLSAARSLNALGLPATFYVNAGRVGKPGRMTWPQLRGLSARGNEIAGHGLRHIDLTTLGTSEAREEICDDRSTLTEEGLTATTFAFPNGHHTPELEQLVRGCGYVAARALGGVVPSRVCPPLGRCAETESVPPFDPLATRTAPPINRRTELRGLQAAVRRAELTGGWLQLVFHQIGGPEPAAVSDATLSSFARWLAPRAVLGTRVATAAQAVGAPASATPNLPPVTVKSSDTALVRPSAGIVTRANCPAACLVEVTATPTAPAAAALGIRRGVTLAQGSATRTTAGSLRVRLLPRAATVPRPPGTSPRVLLRLTTTVTTTQPAAPPPAR